MPVNAPINAHGAVRASAPVKSLTRCSPSWRFTLLAATAWEICRIK